ncbi:MAG: hypothetical protein JWQ09_3834 [Segetibacter sp.]|nr:hypothetical protein [Segetibacter sp.]
MMLIKQDHKNSAVLRRSVLMLSRVLKSSTIVGLRPAKDVEMRQEKI